MTRGLLSLLLLPTLAAAAAPVRGAFTLPHVSGAAPLRDGRLALVAHGPNGVFILPGAPATGRVTVGAAESLAGALKGQKTSLDDLEDAAWDGVDTLFVAGSHARDPLGDSPEARYRLGRLRFDATGKLLEAGHSDALLQAIQTEVPFLADSIRRTPARSGLNVEGLAFTPEGHLLVGLRAPTITESTPRPHGGQEDAVVLRIKNADGLFEKPQQPALMGDTVKLDLRGQGIRGMAYDPTRKGIWILSGLSAEPTHAVTGPWALWFWDEKGAPKEVILPDDLQLKNPEAVCPLQVDGRPHLLLIEDGAKESPFALIPTPVPAP